MNDTETSPWAQDADTLTAILDQLGFPLKHLDNPIDGAFGACEQEQVIYLIEVLDGHIDTLMSNEGVKQAIANAMKKGH
tara:strand:+ start:283 stop:519 length:237 start_codon:yes stop_codon:yes gene_type:complete